MAANGEAKKAAQDDRDSWKRTGIISGALGSALSIGAGGAAAAAAGAVIGGPIVVVGLLVTLGLKTNANLKTVEAERKVEDPPRADFLEATIPVMVLPFRDGFGESELERALSALTRATIETVSLESAMVTAEERLLGARSLGADEYAELRWMENMELRAAAGRWNLQLAHHSRAMAHLYRRNLMEESDFPAVLESLENFPWKEFKERDLGSSLEERFPEVVQTLSQAGFPPHASLVDLPAPEEIGSPIERAGELPGALEEAAETAAAYGRSLISSVEIDLPPNPPPLSFGSLNPYRPRYPLGFWSERFRT